MHYKIFNDGDSHHGFQYQDGLNVDKHDFAESGTCVSGGFYFTTIEHIHNFLGYGDWIRQVDIPEGETQVVKDPSNDKWRSHSLFLYPKLSLKENSTWEFLIEKGIDVNCAIQRASQHGHLAVVELLLKHGADCTADDNIAIQWASQHGHLAIVELLLKHGADGATRDNFAIQRASSNGHLALVELLFKHGADCTARNNFAIQLASSNGHLAVVELLLKHGAKL